MTDSEKLAEIQQKCAGCTGGPYYRDKDRDGETDVIRDATGCRIAIPSHFLIAAHEANANLLSSSHELLRIATAQQAELTRLREAIFWALGVNGEFPPREDGDGPYWWRMELRKRAGISAQELNDRAALQPTTGD